MHLNSVLLFFCFILLTTTLSAQQITDTNASWIPVNHIYVIDEYDSKQRTVSVNSIYVGEQPESNRAYHCYLEAIKKEGDDSLYQAALPKIEYLRKSAGRRHAEFFATEYLFDKKYAHYPALGLDLQQIQNYFKWKGQQLRDAYQSYLAEAKIADVEKYNLEYRLLSQATTLSAIKTGYKRNYKPRRDSSLVAFHTWLKRSSEFYHLTPSPRSALQVRHPSLKKYGIQTVPLYGLEYTRERLGRNGKLTELFSSYGKQKMEINTIYEITTLVGLTLDRRIRVTLDYERTALIPFRYFSIDLDSTYTGKEKGKFSTF